jgi:hypothetical protein
LTNRKKEKKISMLDSVNQQTPTRNKGERKEQIVLESSRKKTNDITIINKYFSKKKDED